MDLRDDLESERNRVRNIAEMIRQSGIQNNDLIEKMNKEPDDSALKSIRNSFDTAQKVSAEMKALERDSADIKDATFKLKRKLTSLEPEWDAKLSFAEENGEFGWWKVSVIPGNNSPLNLPSHQNGEQHPDGQLDPGESGEYLREEQREDENVERDYLGAIAGAEG